MGVPNSEGLAGLGQSTAKSSRGHVAGIQTVEVGWELLVLRTIDATWKGIFSFSVLILDL